MFVLSAIPAVVQGIGMFFLPKSPRYLMLKKKEESAVSVLKKLRGTSSVDTEIVGIRISITSEKVEVFSVFYCFVCIVLLKIENVNVTKNRKK